MGIYIFSWDVLKEALLALKNQPNCDFGKHVIPYCFDKEQRIFAYEYSSYWKDVGTLQSYWEANMELIDIVPEFNLYEEFWKIYTKSSSLPPQYVAKEASVERCIIGNGCEIHGNVSNSVISANVVIEEGAIVRDSIIMDNTVIKKETVVDKAIIAENVVIGEKCTIGTGEYAESKLDTRVYASDLVVIGENSTVPSNVTVGRNVAISGKTVISDYPDGKLESGDYIIKAGEI